MGERPLNISLPTAGQIRQAIDIYLVEAYGNDRPEKLAELLPAEQFDPAEYLMSDGVERRDHSAEAMEIRSFAIRLGNSIYPNMKLRIARPSEAQGWLFAVDSHDAMLSAPSGSADETPLEQLKQHNAALARAIEGAWDAAGLPSQRSLLREKIHLAKEKLK